VGINLAGKTLLITGASRGMGKAIALRAARDGANIAVAALRVFGNQIQPDNCRTEEIMADAAHAVLCKDARFRRTTA
jgi:citronellol/citronellal dehydrogenase